MAAAAAVARFAGVSRKESLTPCHRLRGRPGSCSSWRARAAEEGRASPSENGVASGRPLVAILWDLDNVSPGVDPERARITARRLRATRRAASAAARSEARAPRAAKTWPVPRISWRSSASPTTPRLPESARGRCAEGVDVRRAESTPDAADMDLGAHVLGFARAWAASERGGADVSEPPPFVTPRAPPRRAPPRARKPCRLSARRVLLTARTTPPRNPSPRRPSRAPPRKPSAPLSSISPRRPSRGTTPSQTRSLRRRRFSSSRRTTTSCTPFPSRGENAAFAWWRAATSSRRRGWRAAARRRASGDARRRGARVRD